MARENLYKWPLCRGRSAEVSQHSTHSGHGPGMRFIVTIACTTLAACAGRAQQLAAHDPIDAHAQKEADNADPGQVRKEREEALQLRAALNLCPLVVVECCAFEKPELAPDKNPAYQAGPKWDRACPAQEPPECTTTNFDASMCRAKCSAGDAGACDLIRSEKERATRELEEGVLFTTPEFNHEAEYDQHRGTSDEHRVHATVQRKFKFRFPYSVIRKADPSIIRLDGSAPEMVPDDSYTLRQYLESDVAEAVKASQLQELRFKEVDCRVVARRMVENLIGYRVEAGSTSAVSSGARAALRFQDRDDAREEARPQQGMFHVMLVAEQLDRITILRDPSIGAADVAPHFTCGRTVIDGEVARCGELVVKFNPLEAQSGPFKGQRAVVFDPDTCGAPDPNAYVAERNLAHCELLVQVQGCGLRHTLKADDAQVFDAAALGLADFLEAAKNDAVEKREGRR